MATKEGATRQKPSIPKKSQVVLALAEELKKSRQQKSYSDSEIYDDVLSFREWSSDIYDDVIPWRVQFSSDKEKQSTGSLVTRSKPEPPPKPDLCKLFPTSFEDIYDDVVVYRMRKSICYSKPTIPPKPHHLVVDPVCVQKRPSLQDQNDVSRNNGSIESIPVGCKSEQQELSEEVYANAPISAPGPIWRCAPTVYEQPYNTPGLEPFSVLAKSIKETREADTADRDPIPGLEPLSISVESPNTASSKDEQSHINPGIATNPSHYEFDDHYEEASVFPGPVEETRLFSAQILPTVTVTDSIREIPECTSQGEQLSSCDPDREKYISEKQLDESKKQVQSTKDEQLVEQASASPVLPKPAEKCAALPTQLTLPVGRTKYDPLPDVFPQRKSVEDSDSDEEYETVALYEEVDRYQNPRKDYENLGQARVEALELPKQIRPRTMRLVRGAKKKKLHKTIKRRRNIHLSSRAMVEMSSASHGSEVQRQKSNNRAQSEYLLKDSTISSTKRGTQSQHTIDSDDEYDAIPFGKSRVVFEMLLDASGIEHIPSCSKPPTRRHSMTSIDKTMSETQEGDDPPKFLETIEFDRLKEIVSQEFKDYKDAGIVHVCSRSHIEKEIEKLTEAAPAEAPPLPGIVRPRSRLVSRSDIVRNKRVLLKRHTIATSSM